MRQTRQTKEGPGGKTLRSTRQSVGTPKQKAPLKAAKSPVPKKNAKNVGSAAKSPVKSETRKRKSSPAPSPARPTRRQSTANKGNEAVTEDEQTPTKKPKKELKDDSSKRRSSRVGDLKPSETPSTNQKGMPKTAQKKTPHDVKVGDKEEADRSKSSAQPEKRTPGRKSVDKTTARDGADQEVRKSSNGVNNATKNVEVDKNPSAEVTRKDKKVDTGSNLRIGRSRRSIHIDDSSDGDDVTDDESDDIDDDDDEDDDSITDEDREVIDSGDESDVDEDDDDVIFQGEEISVESEESSEDEDVLCADNLAGIGTPLRGPDSGDHSQELYKRILKLETEIILTKRQNRTTLRDQGEKIQRLQNDLKWKDEQLEEMGVLADRNMELESKLSHLVSDPMNYEEELKNIEESKEKEEKKANDAKEKAAAKTKKKDPSSKNGSKSDEDTDQDESDENDGSPSKKRKRRSSKRSSKKVEDTGPDEIDAYFVEDDDDSDVVVTGEVKAKDASSSDSKTPVPETKKSDQEKEEKEEKSDENEKDPSDDDSDEKNEGDGPQKGRHNIRKMMAGAKLQEGTKQAAKAEKDRVDRAKKEHDKHLVVTVIDPKTKEPMTKQLVLAFKAGTKSPQVEVNQKLIKKMKPHQVAAVEFIWDSLIESMDKLKEKEEGSGCILAHCMGLGKTLSVIALVHTLLTTKAVGMKRCLVVCPLNTVLNWQHEWEKWLDKKDRLKVYELISCKNNHQRADELSTWRKTGGIMIMGYQLFRILVNYCGRSKRVKKILQETLNDPGPELVVCDEGHILKNDSSAVSKCMNSIKTKRRIVLTGTPLQNNLIEYHCMVNFVKPNLLGSRREFCNRFINPITNGQHSDSTPQDVKVMKRRAHILHSMLDGCVQRRDYSALVKFLPPKCEYVISVRLSELQMQLYKKYLELHRPELTAFNMNGGEGRFKIRGSGLFSDYQNLMRIWTHPWVLKLDEIRQEKKPYTEDDDDELESVIFASSDEEIVVSDSSPETTTDDEPMEISSESEAEEEEEEKTKEEDKTDEATRRPTRRTRSADNSKKEDKKTGEGPKDKSGPSKRTRSLPRGGDKTKDKDNVGEKHETKQEKNSDKKTSKKTDDKEKKKSEDKNKKKRKSGTNGDETKDKSESDSAAKTEKSSQRSTRQAVSKSKETKTEKGLEKTKSEKSNDTSQPGETAEDPTTRKAKLIAGEVIKHWQSSSRGDGQPDGDLVRKKKDPWWYEFVKEEHKPMLELSGKLLLMFEILRMAESLGDKVLVFSQSLLTLDLIEDFLAMKNEEVADKKSKNKSKVRWVKDEDYCRMDGSTGAQHRKKLTTNFNNLKNKRMRLFLISTRAGGLGINLDSANRVIIFDASWNPSHDVQSIFRVYRFGQLKDVYIYRFLAQGTMEEKIYDRQIAKETLSQRVIDEHQIDRHFTAADLRELYNFKPDRLDDPNKPQRPTPAVPKDLVLAELLTEQKDWIVQYHEHDSLLENRPDEDLNEEERKAAWEDYEREKKGISGFYRNVTSFSGGILGAYQASINQSQAAHVVRPGTMFNPQIRFANPNLIYPTTARMAANLGPANLNAQVAQLPRVVQEILKYNPSITSDELSKRLQAFLGMHTRYTNVPGLGGGPHGVQTMNVPLPGLPIPQLQNLVSSFPAFVAPSNPVTSLPQTASSTATTSAVAGNLPATNVFLPSRLPQPGTLPADKS